MTRIVQDLRYAFRSLRKQPGFALVVVLTLALGIGANTAVFSIIDALVLRPFPIPEIDRQVMVFETLPSKGMDRGQVSPANFVDWRESNSVFERMEAFHWWEANLTGSGDPERLQGSRVTPGFLSLLGVKPALGRLFRPDDPADEHSTVLSHAFWTRRFASDPQILGRNIRLNGSEYAVVGVAPAGFDYPFGTEVWAPLVLDAETAAVRGSHYLSVIARLQDSATPEDAQNVLDLVAARLAERFPDTNQGRGVQVMALSRAVVDLGAPAFLLVWQVTVIFVLLIACVNVANLMLVRGADRQMELSLRIALGASRFRVTRQLLTENLLLAAAGALSALPLAWLALKLLRDSMPAEIRRFVMGWSQIDIDYRLLLFTGLLAVVTALLFGLVPSLAASRTSINQVLNEGGRSGTESPRRQRGRRLLVVGEIAIALMLLVAAGLTVQGSMRMIAGDQGYNADNLLTFQLTLTEEKYDGPEPRRDFFEQLLLRLQSLPRVTGATAVNILPANGASYSNSYEWNGRPAQTAADRSTADLRFISPSYFGTMQIPLLEGRAFTSQDRADGLPVVIVSRTLARREWPQGSPLGKTLRLADEEQWRTVVGVADDVVQHWFVGGDRSMMYFPMAQQPRRQMSLALRVQGDPYGLAPPVRAQVRSLDANLPVYNLQTMQRAIYVGTIGLQYASGMMGSFGVIALLLALVGIYGQMAYSVSRRRREIGIRIALGAARQDVLRLTLGNAGYLAGLGIAVGLLLAWGAGRFMESFLFGSIQLNLATYCLFAVLLAAASLIAAYLPSRRAMRVDPTEALRAE